MTSYMFIVDGKYETIPAFQYKYESGVTDSIKATRVANKRFGDILRKPGRWKPVPNHNSSFEWVVDYGR